MEKSVMEVLTAEVSISSRGNNNKFDSGEKLKKIIDCKLQELNDELDSYTSHADRQDYAVAVASGIVSGLIDSFFVEDFSLEKAHKWGSDKTEKVVVKIAKARGYKGDNPKGAIQFLAERAPHSDPDIKPGFHLAADSNTNEFGGGYNHHLRDFAHHASVTGLIFSILTQFTGKSYGTDTSGKFIVVEVKDKSLIGTDIPHKFLFGVVFWFFHLVSDMAGSGIADSEGTGIPGVILSMAKVLSSTPLFSKHVNEGGNQEFSVFLSKLFTGTLFGHWDNEGKFIKLRMDFRSELGILKQLSGQALPVALYMVLVKAFYMIRRLTMVISKNQIAKVSDLENLDWKKIVPAGNRTIDRMIAVAGMTFTMADTADAAVRAAVESGGNWVVFAGRFFARVNYVGAGRAALAIVKEISGEQKEAQLIHERMILLEIKADLMYRQLQEFKIKLEEKLNSYLMEDITAFIDAFDKIDQGIETGNSDLVISGNVIIQNALGRIPQFTSQKEFDDLMNSDIPLQL